MRLRLSFLLAGIVTTAIALLLAPAAARASAMHTWPPFVLVAGLLIIGVVANEDGVFRAASSLLTRTIRGRLRLYLASMGLAAVVTALLNLDTSVAFLTPVLVQAARLREAGEERFLYGCVFMSNAASLLLPGSNLTNLLILAYEHINGSVFFANMLLPWMASAIVTAAVVAIAFRPGHQPSSGDRTQRFEYPRPLSLVGVTIAIALILLLADSALPVLAAGLVLAIARIAQRRLSVRAILHGLDILSLLAVYLVAVSLGTLARTWSYPAEVMRHASVLGSAAIGVLCSVLFNNLPAAVLLGSHMPAHPRALLFGLNIGPNLAVSGSLSALIWWRAARSVEAQPSARRYSAVGLFLVPLTLAAVILSSRVPL